MPTVIDKARMTMTSQPDFPAKVRHSLPGRTAGLPSEPLGIKAGNSERDKRAHSAGKLVECLPGVQEALGLVPYDV